MDMTDLYLIGGAIVAVLVAAWRLVAHGRKQERQETALEAAERISATRKRMDDAPTSIGATDAAVIDRLRDHAKR
jgi:hypothetical protein